MPILLTAVRAEVPSITDGAKGCLRGRKVEALLLSDEEEGDALSVTSCMAREVVN